MNGPEHYRKAERLLAGAELDMCSHAEGNIIEHNTSVARAQVHATLALAAATISAGGQQAYANEWIGVLE